jgi:phosphoribosylformylglycinamidine cyclo-ligase
MKKAITYKASGVDIKKGARLVRIIKPYAKATIRKGVIAGIGGFGALYNAGFKNYRNPVLVSSTDGVGTKLKLACMANRHDTIGIDLVAMSVNDIITSGAEPLFFLDYLATSKLDVKGASQLIKGIAKGCREAGCALIGGETAEMPGVYKPGEYDIAGFAVGVVEKSKIINGSSIRAGDKIIGLASSGLHSNGYSLARKVFFGRLGIKFNSRVKGLKKNIGAELLTPTRIYVKPLLAIQRFFRIKGIAHITGGGLIENIPRILPKGYKAMIEKGSWPVQPIFMLIQRLGPIPEDEMFRTFNYGIGMILIVPKRDSKGVIERLKKLKEKPYLIGEVVKKDKREEAVVIE